MNSCQLIETPLGNGRSRYACPNCERVSELPSGLAHARRMCRKPGPPGPGTCLALLLKEIGVEPDGDCKCFQRAQAMDANGLDWCRENVSTIVSWLKETASESSWSTVFAAGAGLIGKPWFSIRAPYESIVAEAIRRAESAATQ